MEDQQILLRARASECGLSRRLNTRAMHGAKYSNTGLMQV